MWSHTIVAFPFAFFEDPLIPLHNYSFVVRSLYLHCPCFAWRLVTFPNVPYDPTRCNDWEEGNRIYSREPTASGLEHIRLRLCCGRLHEAGYLCYLCFFLDNGRCALSCCTTEGAWRYSRWAWFLTAKFEVVIVCFNGRGLAWNG